MRTRKLSSTELKFLLDSSSNLVNLEVGHLMHFKVKNQYEKELRDLFSEYKKGGKWEMLITSKDVLMAFIRDTWSFKKHADYITKRYSDLCETLSLSEYVEFRNLESRKEMESLNSTQTKKLESVHLLLLGNQDNKPKKPIDAAKVLSSDPAVQTELSIYLETYRDLLLDFITVSAQLTLESEEKSAIEL